MNKLSLIIGRHALEEAFDQFKPIEKVFLLKSIRGPFEKYVRQTCRERTIPLSYVEKGKLDKMTRHNHQGVVALGTVIHYLSIEDLIPYVYEHYANPLLLAADGVTDVGNMGAIARSCEVFGVGGLLLPTEGSAAINDHAIKASAGALMHLPVVRTHSLVKALQYTKDSGFRIIGLDGASDTEVASFDHKEMPTVLVVGSEDKGINREIALMCDHILSIRQSGQLDSLNVSVAAGIALYEMTLHRKPALNIQS